MDDVRGRIKVVWASMAKEKTVLLHIHDPIDILFELVYNSLVRRISYLFVQWYTAT